MCVSMHVCVPVHTCMSDELSVGSMAFIHIITDSGDPPPRFHSRDSSVQICVCCIWPIDFHADQKYVQSICFIHPGVPVGRGLVQTI